jgi:predicted nicotinamide N-methyase
MRIALSGYVLVPALLRYGLVLWKITPLFAAWISSPRNLFARCGVLSQDARALELGCGISGLVSLALAPHVAKYVNTDQEYVLKYVKENVEGNYSMFRPAAKAAMKKGGKKQQTPATTKEDTIGNIMIKPLDWETSSLLALYKDLDISHLDLLISCDCIYNEALIDPLITTMRDICQLAQSKDKPTVCIVAQQLRSPDVLETWLRRFCESFRVWRVPDKELDEGLREGSGYIVHAGLLKEELQV